MSHTKYEIDRAIRIPQNEPNENTTWATITSKPKKKSPVRREYGEPPLPMGYEFTNLNTHKKNKKVAKKKHVEASKESLESTIDSDYIAAKVREATGGWNTQSYEIQEKYHRAVQEQNELSRSLNSSIDTATSSSQTTTTSYSTAFEDSSELAAAAADLEIRSEKSFSEKYDRYKRNALITNVLRDLEYNFSDKASSSETSSNFMDATQTSFPDNTNEVDGLNLNDEAEGLRNDRLHMFFQSEEDPDVYRHGLMELHKDPEWQQLRLARKAIEVTQTPRQYFMNLEAEDFEFVKPKQDKK